MRWRAFIAKSINLAIIIRLDSALTADRELEMGLRHHTSTKLLSTLKMSFRRGVKVLSNPADAVRLASYILNPDGRDETACQFTSSRGLLKSCTARNKHPTSRSSKIDRATIEGLTPYGSLYLSTNAIEEFAHQYLESLKFPFTLVTGDSDRSVSFSSIDQRALTRLLESERITNWFAQNLCIRHPKVMPLPVAMDYHTLARRLNHPWGAIASPTEQEQLLLRMRNKRRRLSEKRTLCYANWHFQLGRGDRSECLSKLDPRTVFFEPQPLQRKDSWANNANFAFSVSPSGNGLDCHRTWEAMLLGSVPIVKTSPLDGLYQGLPVCIVTDWREVSPDYLRQKLDEIQGATYDFRPLYLSYWVPRIHGRERPEAKPMSFQDFLDNV